MTRTFVKTFVGYTSEEVDKQINDYAKQEKSHIVTLSAVVVPSTEGEKLAITVVFKEDKTHELS